MFTRNGKEYRRFCKRRQIALQKAVFYKLKGHLLEAKRWPFITH